MKAFFGNHEKGIGGENTMSSMAIPTTAARLDLRKKKMTY
jgi:hypothetical protein